METIPLEKSQPGWFRYLANVHFGWFWLIFFLAQLMVAFPPLLFEFLPEGALENTAVDMLRARGKTMVLYSTVIFAPIIETFICQFSVIKLFRLMTKRFDLTLFIAVPLSAFLFAIGHWFSIYYVVAMFLAGILLALAFVVGMYRRDLPAFLNVAIIHASWNLFAFVAEEVF